MMSSDNNQYEMQMMFDTVKDSQATRNCKRATKHQIIIENQTSIELEQHQQQQQPPIIRCNRIKVVKQKGNNHIERRFDDDHDDSITFIQQTSNTIASNNRKSISLVLTPFKRLIG